MELIDLAKGYYRAYETNDRAFVESNLADGFTFTSPFDDHIGREDYFRRCWPEKNIHFRFDVHPAARFRNAELMTFENGKLKSVEVFFGDPPNGLTRREFAVQSGAA
jgi:hypothetical protein